MNLYFKDRTFKLWKYSVSFSTLLMRSPKTSDSLTNIDLIFYGVKLIKMPSIFKCHCLTSLSFSQDATILKEVGSETPKEEVFILKSDSESYYIIASFFNIEENEKEFWED